MHLIQINDSEFIDANKIERIGLNCLGRMHLVCNGKIHFVNDKFRQGAINDILMNCTPTSGRDALQGMVSG